jgi:cytochrome P450
MLPGGLPPAALETMLADMNVILAGVTWRSVLPKSLDRMPTPANRRYRRAQERLRGVVTGVIEDYRARGTDQIDLLSGLLGSFDPGPPGLTDAEIHDQVLTFLLAGTETTANVVSWALHLVAQHPELEERLRAEAAGVLGDGEITVAELAGLTVSRQVVLETMRLYPPVPFLTRITTVDTQLGGHAVPAGTTVVYSPYVAQRQAGNFPEPEAFRPERWEDGQDPLKLPRGPFLAFGGGARRCVGDTFGLFEAMVMLSTITRRWSLQPVRGSRVRPAVSLVLTPRALHMRLRALDTSGAAA